ncbi:MAG: protein-export chaperone SecB [Proteobacteria bacterium]|nr:protein-export chaperone SecB [Pseudomonadota bacterium]MBU1711195.1 protein-export chaperone SecB [Pseudomonadota bacterium]
MSDQNSTKPQMENAPIFRLQKMYLKDLSFESPHSPQVFMGQQVNPKVDINLALNKKKLDDDHHEVAISITANVNDASGKTLFVVEVEHAGVFMLKNIPDEHIHTVLMVECPALLFPFTRQIVSQLSVDGGFTPFLMEPVNFFALYENAKRQGKDEQQKQ